jgi:hypothetical protein
VSFENLLTAFKKAYRGCSGSVEAMDFYVRRESGLIRLKRELQDNKIKGV